MDTGKFLLRALVGSYLSLVFTKGDWSALQSVCAAVLTWDSVGSTQTCLALQDVQTICKALLFIVFDTNSDQSEEAVSELLETKTGPGVVIRQVCGLLMI